MGNPLVLSLSLCFLLLFSASCCLARQQQPQQFNQCQLDQLEALEPNHVIEAEAGLIESWDHNHDQLQCAGVAVVRRTIEPNGLHLPSYTNAPQLHYIIRGEGILGTAIPGCPETYEEAQSSDRRERSEEQQDRHQKIRRFREGDIIALPAGVAYWTYNTGDESLVAITLLDTSNLDNQLDQNPRRFYLAGNPENEHPPRQEDNPRHQGSRGRQSEESEGNNVFSGFDEEFLAEILGLDNEIVRRIQGRRDDRSNIVKVKEGLRIVSPWRRRGEERERESEEKDERERERREEKERERERRHGRGRGHGHGNGIEETICSLRLRENICDASRADFYNPQAGRISSLNSFNLPILKYIQLSAQKVNLYNRGIFAPHWNLNAHGIAYITRGRGRVQVVDDDGNSVFDGEVKRGQLLVVPQNFVSAVQAGSGGLEAIFFKTNDNALINPLVGRSSALRALPLDVISNAFNVPKDDARDLKHNIQESILLSPRSSQSRRMKSLIQTVV